MILSGWRSSPEEGEALTQTLLGFAAEYPNIQVDYQPIAGDYRNGMLTRVRSGDTPDLFMVKADYAPDWIEEAFLLPLDDYIEQSGFDTTQFFDAYLRVFQANGSTYGMPLAGDTIAMAYNSAMVTAAPTTMAELITVSEGLKGKHGLTAPMCLSPGLDTGLAFIYAQGGEVLARDGSSAIQTEASAAAVQWYLDLFRNGLGMTAAQLGSGWCGEALGRGQVAIAFEGGWLDPFMTSTYPEVDHSWGELPVGTSGRPVTISYTTGYSIGAGSVNKDQAFVLLSYLVGPDGVTTWTQGGIALPSRKDVGLPQGADALAAGRAYARPGSGFMPAYADVQVAFRDAFVAQIQGQTYNGQAVVDATKGAIDQAIR